MDAFLFYLGAGVVAGLLSGLFGVGGGAIIVPILLLAYAAQGFAEHSMMHLAIGSSLASIVLTSIASMRAHHRKEGVLWPVFWRMTGGIVAGALLGAVIARQLSSEDLQLVFGIFLLVIAARLAFGGNPAPHRKLPGTVGLAGSGVGIGAMSAIVGIGGGALTVPWLAWCGVEMRKAVGTSAACGLPIAVFGALGFIVTGWNVPGLPPLATGYVYWPAVVGIVIPSFLLAPLGARLAHFLPAVYLRRGFALLQVSIGLRLLLA